MLFRECSETQLDKATSLWSANLSLPYLKPSKLKFALLSSMENQASAALIRCGVMGSCHNRTPMAS